MKNWPHRPGTCRAVIWAHGPQVVVCHPCRRYAYMPALEVPFDPCPFVCARCRARGEIRDADDAPPAYSHETRRTGREFVAPKLRWKPTR
ncbi:hypothetical protein [Reyranella sp.]|uniref:hypothetical protein n=1 Tax=Reyranella sp. TaxID=1929291 RepID=UPI003D0DED20